MWNPLGLAFLICLSALLFQIPTMNAVESPNCFECFYSERFSKGGACLNPKADDTHVVKCNGTGDSTNKSVCYSTVFFQGNGQVEGVFRGCYQNVPEDSGKRGCYEKLPFLACDKFSEADYFTPFASWKKCGEQGMTGAANETETNSGQTEADPSGGDGGRGYKPKPEGNGQIEVCTCDSDYCNTHNSGPRPSVGGGFWTGVLLASFLRFYFFNS